MLQISTIRFFAFSLLMAQLIGCASINSVSLTPIGTKRDKPVRAEVSRFIFLGFNFDNDYINPLVNDLKRQCPNGVISGILTKDETISYFIAFTKRVVATGFCNNSSTTASNAKGPRKPSSTADEIVDETVEN
ncbi:MAG: hypothetical protein ACXVCP_15045 [Bdellovibrio sp.]